MVKSVHRKPWETKQADRSHAKAVKAHERELLEASKRVKKVSCVCVFV
jgi:hypothetical protein